MVAATVTICTELRKRGGGVWTVNAAEAALGATQGMVSSQISSVEVAVLTPAPRTSSGPSRLDGTIKVFAEEFAAPALRLARPLTRTNV
jgi:hypothetical protein